MRRGDLQENLPLFYPPLPLRGNSVISTIRERRMIRDEGLDHLSLASSFLKEFRGKGGGI